MWQNRKALAAFLTLTLLLGLCLLLNAQIHESGHQANDCPLCQLAQLWQTSLRFFAAAFVAVIHAVVCRSCRRRAAVKSRLETLAAQKVLLLS